MTVLRKSDSQLDAEAAATGAIRAVVSESTRYSPMGAQPPRLMCEGQHLQRVIVRDRHGSAHITACCLVFEARLEWHYALPYDLHVFRVPSDLETIPDVGEVLDAGELGGPAFSITFIGHLEHHPEAIVRGLRQYRVKCAGEHRHRPDHRDRAVCGALLWSVVANGNTIADAADAIDMTPERATGLLGEALRLVWSWRSQEANGLDKGA